VTSRNRADYVDVGGCEVIAFTLGLLTNDEVLEVHRARLKIIVSCFGKTTWCLACESTASDDQYLAIFNAGDALSTVEVDLALVGKTHPTRRVIYGAKRTSGAVQGKWSQNLHLIRQVSIVERYNCIKREIAANAANSHKYNIPTEMARRREHGRNR